MRNRFASGTGRLALCGILIALSTALLCLAGTFPSGKLGLVAAAGLPSTIAVLASGRPAGFLCWAGSGILGLLLMAEKWLGLLYLAFLGLYPVVKSVLESLKSRVLEWVCKLAYFNASLAVFLALFQAVFLTAIPEALHQGWVLFLAGNAVFVVYDFGLSKLIGLLIHYLAPALGLKR